MAKRKRRIATRRKGSGGGRYGVNFGEAAMGAAAETVGAAVQAAIPQSFPQFLQTAPVTGLGLYIMGIAFNKKSVRSIGAGMVLGKLVNLGSVLGG